MNYEMMMRIVSLVVLSVLLGKLIATRCSAKGLQNICPSVLTVGMIGAIPGIIKGYKGEGEILGMEYEVFMNIYSIIAIILILISCFLAFVPAKELWSMISYKPKKMFGYHSIKNIPLTKDSLRRLKDDDILFIEDCGECLLRNIINRSEYKFEDVYDYIRDNNITLKCSRDAVFYLEIIYEDDETVKEYAHQIDFIVERIKNKKRLGNIEEKKEKSQ